MSFADYYKRGIAIGKPDIKSDCIVFFFKSEEFAIPSSTVLSFPQLAHFNGANYEAKIKDIRKAAKAAKE